MVEVIIVSAQPVFGEGLRVIVEQSRLASVSGVYRSLPDLDAARCFAPGTLLLVESDKSFDTTKLRGLCQTGNHRVCLFVSELATEFMYQLREAGIAAIISTRRGEDDLVSILSAAAEGQFFFDPMLARPDEQSASVHLSPREAQLVELLTRGLKNKEIAAQLGITEGTVKVYLSKLFHKVGAKDRFELALNGLKNLGFTQTAATSEDEADPAGAQDALRTFVTRNGPARDGRNGRRMAS